MCALSSDAELGQALQGVFEALEAGRFQAAEQIFRQMQFQASEHPLTHFAQGLFVYQRKAYRQAAQIFERVVQADAQMTKAWLYVAISHWQAGDFARANQALAQACLILPDELSLWQRLLFQVQSLGDNALLKELFREILPQEFVLVRKQRLPQEMAEAFEHWHRSVQAQFLLTLYAEDQASTGDILELLQDFNRPLQGLSVQQHYANLRDPQRKLRLGWVGNEAHTPAGQHGYVELIQALSADFEQVYYHDAQDELPLDVWGAQVPIKKTSELDPWQFFVQIQNDGIDVLLDTSGVFNLKRQSALALKPAPIQISCGSNPPFSSGLKGFDYLLSDPHLNLAQWPQVSEQIYAMPAFFRWTPRLLKASPRPARQIDFERLRLGSSASPNKMSDATLGYWAQILTAFPGAQLHLRALPFADAQCVQRFQRRFVAAGGDLQRLHCVSNTSDYAGFIQSLDLILDTLPYQGALSSCDALYLGTPVLSVVSERRISSSVFHTLGLEDCLVGGVSEAVQRLREWCEEPEAFAVLRGQLRERLLNSPICDIESHAQQLRELIQQAWQDFCHRA